MGLLILPELLIKISIILLVIILLIVIFFVFRRVYFFKSLSQQTDPQQMGELINSTTFVTKDLEKLKCSSKINKKKKLIIIACDFFQTIESLSDFEESISNEEFDYIIYEQRKFDSNPQKRGLGIYISDLNEIINNLKEKNTYEEIILIGSGISSNLWLHLSKKNKFDKLILINYSNKSFNHELKENKYIFFGTLFNMYASIKCSINVENISHNSNFNKDVLQLYIERGFITVREYHQMNRLISRFLIYLKNNKSNIYFLNSSNNSNLKANTFLKRISTSKNQNIKVEVFKKSKHFLLNDDEKEDVFGRIKGIIKNKEV